MQYPKLSKFTVVYLQSVMPIYFAEVTELCDIMIADGSQK